MFVIVERKVLDRESRKEQSNVQKEATGIKLERAIVKMYSRRKMIKGCKRQGIRSVI